MKELKFSELFDFQKKSKIKAGDGLKLKEGLYPFYTSSSLLSKSINNAEFRGDSLIFGTGGKASIHFEKKEFSVSTDCLVAQPKNEDIVFTGFVHFYINGNIHILEEGFRGAGLKHISKQYISDLQIPIPTLETQKQITQILDDAQALKQETKKLIVEYDTLAQSIFLDMFGDTWTNPFGIKKMKLSEITHNDKIITYGIVQAGEEVEGGVPYIRTGDLKKGKILVNQLKRTSHEIAKSYERSKCLTGDIIMSIRATVGTIAILPEELNGCNLTQGTARISADPKIMNNTYLFHCIDSKGVQLKIDKDTKGATFKEITLGRLRNIEIPVPTIGLQNQFAEKIALIEQQKELAKRELKESEDLFNRLLQKAFKGELVC